MKKTPKIIFPIYLKVTCLKMKKYEEAIENYQKCVKLNKNCAEAYTNIAICQAYLGQNQEALDNLDVALNLNRDLPQAIDARGSILYNMKEYPEALICFNTLVEKDPTNPEYHFKKVQQKKN